MDLSTADFKLNSLVVSNKKIAEVENGRAYHRQDNDDKGQDWKN